MALWEEWVVFVSDEANMGQQRGQYAYRHVIFYSHSSHSAVMKQTLCVCVTYQIIYSTNFKMFCVVLSLIVPFFLALYYIKINFKSGDWSEGDTDSQDVDLES